jgi:hypothetical protein
VLAVIAKMNVYTQRASVFGDRFAAYLSQALKHEVDVMDGPKMEAEVLRLVKTLLQ